MECKKAQPKEVVQAANTAALLGKRVILSNLGILPGLNLPSMGPTTPTPAAAAAIPQISQQQPQLTASHTALQAALQQQLAASAALGIHIYIKTITVTGAYHHSNLGRRL